MGVFHLIWEHPTQIGLRSSERWLSRPEGLYRNQASGFCGEFGPTWAAPWFRYGLKAYSTDGAQLHRIDFGCL